MDSDKQKGASLDIQQDKRGKIRRPYQCNGVVEGQLVNDIVLDTGCSSCRTLVRSDLLREKDFNQRETVTVQCAHGDVVTYPLTY